MCGIAGFCNFYSDYTENREYWNKVLTDMRRAVAHRGSDNTGEYLRKNVGLSHTRLAIRDLCNGAQPIIKNISGREFAIVYNGEIYNTDELMPELSRAGYRFETTTDTEVILYAYIHYGIDFVNRLNGIFAFAIWDEELERVVLYRDRVGVKPLFYTVMDDTLVFGSEIKVLFRFPGIKPELDINGFREIFGIGPARTYNPNYEKLLMQIFMEIINNPNSPVLSLIDRKKTLAFMKAPAEYGKPWFGQLMAAPQLLAYMIQVNYWLEKYSVL